LTRDFTLAASRWQRVESVLNSAWVKIMEVQKKISAKIGLGICIPALLFCIETSLMI
jgi:hypothetical protein